MPNFHIRVWYVLNTFQIREIDLSLQQERIPVKDRATRAWAHRRWARLAARSAMRSEEERFLLHLRDRKKYGNPDGPSLEQVKSRIRRDGGRGDSVWEEVIARTWKTDDHHDRMIGKEIPGLIEAMCDGIRDEARRRRPNG